MHGSSLLQRLFATALNVSIGTMCEVDGEVVGVCVVCVLCVWWHALCCGVCVLGCVFVCVCMCYCGDVAQMVERSLSMREVLGSIPSFSNTCSLL